MSYFPLDPLPRFIAQVIAILLLSRLLGRLARRVGQPMVVAEIVAGILLGPSLLGFVAPELSDALFATESLLLLEVVSSLGLVLFMFLIGLELDPELLRGRGRASLLVSQATFVVPLALGGLLALYLHPRWSGEGVSRPTFALFVGTALASTAFPVLARIVAERGLVRSRLGTLALACAAIDGVLAWCLLAFVFASVRATSLPGAIATTVLAILYIGVMFLVVRPLLERLARSVGRGVLSNDRVAAIMLVLFASSWATELIGLHALFGAFLFGAIMPRGRGLSQALSEKLGDIVGVVLLPLFFAYSGVRTHIGLLDSTEAWVTCALLVLVACVGKLVAGTLAARGCGLPWREAGALGALMNTRGLIGLIVLNLGLDFGIIDPALFSMLVVMALVTTFAAKPLLDALYPSRQAVHDLLANERPTTARLARDASRNVLACVSNPRSAANLYALARALSGDDARVHALTLRTPDSKLDAAGVVAGIKPTSFASAEPARDICRMADVKAADLVLLARRLRQGDTLFGRTSARVMAECTRQVGVLLSTTQVQTRDVLVVHDGGPHDAVVRMVAARLCAAGANVVEQHGDAASALERRGFDLVVAGVPDETRAEAIVERWQGSGHGTSLLVLRGAVARETRATA